MSFRRTVGLGAVTLLIATAACTSLLGSFDVDPGSASSGNITDGDGGVDGATSFDASVDSPVEGVDASCGPDLLRCGDRCVGPNSQHCGSCDPCPTSGPICNVPPGDASPFCSSNCSESAPTLCSDTCVDTTSNPSHCGKCDKACPAVTNGAPTCKGDAGCGFDCNDGFHACGAACADNSSTASCGKECTPCPAPPTNALATCDGRSCDFRCDKTFHRCSGGIIGSNDYCAADNSPDTCGDRCEPCPTSGLPNVVPSCDGTKCGFMCRSRLQTMCKDGCFNTQSDDKHCGNCETVCNTTKGFKCQLGTCRPEIVIGP